MNIYMMIGNIGTGKSTKSRKLLNKNNIMYFNDDSLRRAFYDGKYIYSKTDNMLIQNILYDTIEHCIVENKNLIVDQPLVLKKERMNIIRYILNCKYSYNKFVNIICYNFGQGNVYSLENRLNSNRGESKSKWINVHNRFKRNYEEPKLNEGFTEIFKYGEYHAL